MHLGMILNGFKVYLIVTRTPFLGTNKNPLSTRYREWFNVNLELVGPTTSFATRSSLPTREDYFKINQLGAI